jgi:dihydrofolate synthase / folylpolyglutamate synthase
MTYKETLDYLYSQLPMYSRIGAPAFKKDLTNTIKLCEALGNPHQKFRSIHIAGTNGKGSTSHMLAAILQTAGYKTGLYTSPHLKDFRERIRINGNMISEETVIDFVEKNKNEFEKIQPSFFEMTVALAFDHFAKERVDVAVIETGLGGRLDSTNIITPVLSVITNISFDHMDMLGDTLEKIAIEKAGIIKKYIPVVIGESISETKKIFVDKAGDMNAPLSFADENYSILAATIADDGLHLSVLKSKMPFFNNLILDLTGYYQEKNVCTVLQSIDNLNELNFSISEQQIRKALKQVKTLTGLRGRWDVLSEHPLIIADVAHNEGGFKEVFEQLSKQKYNHLHLVIGFVKEKNLEHILPLFPKEANYYLCKPDIPRGLDVNSLKEAMDKFSLKNKAFSSSKLALEEAKRNAQQDDLIYVGGSTFVVAEVI